MKGQWVLDVYVQIIAENKTEKDIGSLAGQFDLQPLGSSSE